MNEKDDEVAGRGIVRNYGRNNNSPATGPSKPVKIVLDQFSSSRKCSNARVGSACGASTPEAATDL